MELPIKFDVPKLTHVHLLQVLSPLIPGTAVMCGLAYARSAPAVQVWTWSGLGYRSKVAAIFLIGYLIGLGLLTLAELLAYGIEMRVRNNVEGIPWERREWRKLLCRYLGPELQPKTTEVIETNEKGPKDLKKSVSATSLENFRKALSSLRAARRRRRNMSGGTAMEKQDASRKVHEAELAHGIALSAIEEEYTAAAHAQVEWAMWYLGIERLCPENRDEETQNTYYSAWFATSVAVFFLAIIYPSLRSFVVLLPLLLIAFGAAEARYSTMVSNALERSFNADQVAFLIKELKTEAAAQRK